MNNQSSSLPEDVMKRHAHHYHTDMGSLPEALVQLAQYAPATFDAYSSMRADLLKSEADGAALSLKFKHIILAVLDVQRDEPLGMINHVRAAMLAGATAAEITESVLLGIIVNGMPAWGKIGRKAVEFAVNFEQEQKKKSGP